MPGLSLSTGLDQLCPPSGQQFDYYLNSAAAPGGDGLTPATAFSTPSQVNALPPNALAGARLGIARGSQSGGESDPRITRTDAAIEIVAYGPGPAPFFDCSASIAGFTKTAGQSNVYEVPIVFPSASVKHLGNVWEGNAYLILVSSLAACNSLPGSAYIANWNSTATTLYIHPIGATDATTDGKARRYSRWPNAIDLTGNAVRVTGISARRNLHQDGSIRLPGENCQIAACALADGSRHAALIGGHTTPDTFALVNVTFQRARNDLEPVANFIVCNQPDLSARYFRTAGCTFDAGDTEKISAIDAHDSVDGRLMAGIEHFRPRFINCQTGTSTAAANVRLIAPSFENCDIGITLGGEHSGAIVEDATGDLRQLAVGTRNATVTHNLTTRRSVLTVRDLAGAGASRGFVLASQTAATLNWTSEDDNFFIGPVVQTSGRRLVEIPRGAVSVTRLKIGPAIGAIFDRLFRLGYSGGTASFASSNCCWPWGADWEINGTVHDHLASLGALDTGSTYADLPAAEFADNFNRANGPIEASIGWTSTTANQARIADNQIEINGTTRTLCSAAPLASDAQWVRIIRKATDISSSFLAVICGSDANNFLGLRFAGTNQLQVLACNAGASSQLATSATGQSLPADSELALARNGNFAIAYFNKRKTSIATLTAHAAALNGKRPGFAPNTSTAIPALDDFACGLVGLTR